MMPKKEDLVLIRQNLIDAGCDEETIQRCMQLAEEDRMTELLPLLAKYKTSLLDTVRTGQKQIDCLDYLVYQIRKYEQV